MLFRIQCLIKTSSNHFNRNVNHILPNKLEKTLIKNSIISTQISKQKNYQLKKFQRNSKREQTF